MMMDNLLMAIGLCVVFAGAVVVLFFVLGAAMSYAWQKMQDAVGFYRLAKCYRRVLRVVEKKKTMKGGAA